MIGQQNSTNRPRPFVNLLELVTKLVFGRGVDDHMANLVIRFCSKIFDFFERFYRKFPETNPETRHLTKQIARFHKKCRNHGGTILK